MAIAPGISQAIEQAAGAWLTQPVPEDPILIQAVQRLRAWPVYSDLGGTLLIDGRGEVYLFNHETMQVRLEPDPYWQTVAWVAAAKKAPALKAALPVRPTDALDCTHCAGAGEVQFPGSGHLGCGRCWGLGWVTPA